MKLEQQVVSLELAKKMKGLGFERGSLFWWGEYTPDNQFKGIMKVCTDLKTDDTANYASVCPAYTVAELGEMLPEKVWAGVLDGCSIKDYFYYQQFGKRIGYWLPSGKSLGESFEAKAEVEARAKMLIWLKENNYL